MAGVANIETCRITDQPAKISAELTTFVESRQLRIKPVENAERLHARMLGNSPALLASSDNQELVIDLRWVPSKFDAAFMTLLSEK
jgi:hypothetical protein